MKVVIASTREQEEKIKQLVNHMYKNIFPHYFSDDEINEFLQLGILDLTDYEQYATLKESFQIICSLQITITLIETKSLMDEHYQQLFKKNVSFLNEIGISFPFSYHHFVGSDSIALERGSIYTKAANEWLV
ncbi:DUF5365 family protein [Bacillus kwashiorkori]|uniref:DUF5365 family protein n=1 Tax=Bacillus kwashiorkori TaxID=1522318 RepID=UPI0007863942|nr:DUF5365 family protein [Bacillus kwashiorkori]